MKSDSKIIELGYTTRRTSDDAFEFFKLVSNFFLSYCYFAQYATKCHMRLNISRNFARVDNISGHYRYNNTLFWCCFNMKNGIFQTSFIIQSFWLMKNFSSCFAQHWHAQFKWWFSTLLLLWKQIIQLKAVWISKREIWSGQTKYTWTWIRCNTSKKFQAACKSIQVWQAMKYILRKSIKYCIYFHDAFKIVATYYWFSQLLACAVLVYSWLSFDFNVSYSSCWG